MSQVYGRHWEPASSRSWSQRPTIFRDPQPGSHFVPASSPEDSSDAIVSGRSWHNWHEPGVSRARERDDSRNPFSSPQNSESRHFESQSQEQLDYEEDFFASSSDFAGGGGVGWGDEIDWNESSIRDRRRGERISSI